METSQTARRARFRGGARAPGLLRQPRLLLSVAVGLLAVGIVVWRTQAARPVATTTGQVARRDVTVAVSGSGSVAPARQLDLAFQVAGEVAEVLVAPGETVAAGQPLARVDDRELRLQVEQAEASLRSAEARLREVRGEGASALDLRQAQLALQAAEIQFEQIAQGDASAADLRSAQASVASARAHLAALTSPDAATRSAAETRVTQAEASLQSTRDSTSSAKTRAELDLQRAVSSLTQAQSRYATARQHWEFVRDTGKNPISPETTSSQGQTVANKLSDGQRQQYYDEFVQAEAALHSAEAAVAQSQVAYDAARQQEVASVTQAEASLRDARAQLDALTTPGAEELAQAEAAVVQAEAQLDKLRSGGTDSDITAAQIQVEQARLALERLTSPASDAEIASAEAAAAQARTQLESARLDLERATLTAPFAATVATIDLLAGQQVGSGTLAATLVDTSGLHVEMYLSESDAGEVAVGQAVTLLFDALPEVTLAGEVTSVAPVATVTQNVVTYLVEVGFEPGEAAVRVGMTASGDIVVDAHPGALVVPSRAVQSQGGVSVVQVQPAAGGPAVPVEVVTGLSSDGQTEIVSCVRAGAQCLREGDVVLLRAATTTTRTTTQSGPRIFGDGGPPPGGVRP